ncbi:hypothetical protein GCM10027053_47610 [Intrasporangium mesophilum]
MPCDGIFKLNPMCLPAAAIESGANVVGGVADSAFGTMAGFFASAANNATTWLWQQINEATALDLQSPQLTTEMAMTGAIAAVLCVALFVIQLIVAAVRGNPVMVGRAFSGLLISFVGSALALAATRVLIGAVDALSNGVVQYTLGTNISGIGTKLAFTQISGMQNPAVVILLALVVLAAVVMVWAAMMIRKLMILVAAVLAPIAFAGATADFARGWVRKWIEFIAAMIASKLLLVIILSLGVAVLNGAGQSGTGVTQTATQLAGGSLILLLGGLTPWMAIRMFHFAGDTLHAAHATARQSAAGAQSVLSGPQKVAAIQGQARALTSAIGSRGGRVGSGDWGRSGGVPPAPPPPALAGWPAPSGPRGGTPATSDGRGTTTKQAGTAASTRGAAATTSAAVPAIGAAATAANTLKGTVNAASSAIPPSTAANPPGSPASPETAGPAPTPPKRPAPPAGSGSRP